MKLVIGYGNTLRCDDGVGQKIATKVAEWEIPGLRSLAVFQLTPELAVDLVEADLVIFVDAVIQSEIEVRKLQLSQPRQPILGHSSDPYTLLALTKNLYNHLPEAYWILVPGVNFEFGETFSEVTEAAMNKAYQEIQKLIQC